MRKIAIVEDNPDNRLLLTALLSDRYELVEYEDGAAALEGIRAAPPDLVLTDISLPEISGEELRRRLREIPELQGMKIVALTAHAMAGDREKFLEMGFDGYVSKPIVDESELFRVVAENLSTTPPG